MDKHRLADLIHEFMKTSGMNVVSEAEALDSSIVGMPLYEEPLFGFATADDLWFERLKEKQAIGPHFLSPREWLPDAKTVISLFFPASKEVRASNGTSWTDPPLAGSMRGLKGWI